MAQRKPNRKAKENFWPKLLSKKKLDAFKAAKPNMETAFTCFFCQAECVADRDLSRVPAIVVKHPAPHCDEFKTMSAMTFMSAALNKRVADELERRKALGLPLEGPADATVRLTPGGLLVGSKS